MREQLGQLRDLVAKLCDEGLSRRDRETLNDLLRTSGALRREYASLMDVHVSLLVHPKITSSPRPFPAWRKQTLRWAMAAAAVASLMGMLFFPIHERVSVDSHFATLIQATDCQWQGQMSPREGEPLGKSVLQLKEGGALVRFSDGVEISLLAPSRFEISGPNTATLYDGELYFSNEMSDSGVRFSLSTPQGKLIDIGTSYSVRIGPDGAEEIHVDDGKVIRFDRHDREFMIEAGQAMRWLEKGQGKEVPFVGKPKAKDHRVVRETQEMLLAWHSFVDRQGSGFAQEWMPWGERGGARVKGAFTSRGFQPAEHTVIAAPLKVPIDMSQNGVTYFSFLCSREKASMTAKNFYFAFRESRSPDHKAQFVVTPKRLTVGAHLLYDDDDSSGRSTMALALPPGGSAFQVVGKFVRREIGSDQLYLRILPEHEPLESNEPFAWTVVGKPVACDFRFDLLSIHMNVAGEIAVSEVNLGMTWRSVTNPHKE